MANFEQAFRKLEFAEGGTPTKKAIEAEKLSQVFHAAGSPNGKVGSMSMRPKATQVFPKTSKEPPPSRRWFLNSFLKSFGRRCGWMKYPLRSSPKIFFFLA